MRRSMLEAHERATNMGRVEMTVGDFRSVWLDDCAGRLTPKTIHFYGWVCDLPMMKPIRALNLNDVTPRQIAKTVAQVTEQHGRRTGLAAFRTLSAMFGLAERWGYLDTNPCRRMQAPTVPKREPTVPPPAVMERAIRIATPEFGALLRFAISSGCRRGEIAGVRWNDFNDELGIVTIRRSIDSTPGNGLAKETKTSRAKVISLDPATLEALEAHKARQTDQGRNNGWAWSRDHDGLTPLRPDLITSRWTSLRKRIPELEGVRFHDIRHALATNIPGNITATRILKIYKDQPLVEIRHREAKGPLKVRPIFLHNDDRITAMLSIVGIALLVYGLIETQLRTATNNQPIPGLYPENRPALPTGRNTLTAFQGLGLTYTHHGIRLDPLTTTQRTILNHLNITPPWEEQDLPNCGKRG